MRREELIQRIKDCGQSIIDNAEKIYGDYKYSYGLTIICHPYEDVLQGDAPRIVIEKRLLQKNLLID